MSVKEDDARKTEDGLQAPSVSRPPSLVWPLTAPTGGLYTQLNMANPASALPRPLPHSGPGPITAALRFMGETWLLAASALGFIGRGRISGRETLGQMSAIGVGSLPIVLAITFSTGAVFAYYTASVFVRFGAVNFVGGTLAYGFFNELGPVLAGVAVAARSGAAVAAEIGSMVVTEQVDALRAMAVPPVRYLVVPRLIACVLMMPILGVFADMAGLMGSYLMAGAHGVPHQAFVESIRQIVVPDDLFRGLVKTLWFGFTIAVVSCHYGLKTRGGATGVGRSTTNSVVLCVVLIFISDFFLAQVLSGGTPGQR